MLKKLAVLIIFLNAYCAIAETIKTDVLVIGSGASAVTAAIQSSRSKLKTVLLVKGSWLENMQNKGMIIINANRNLPYGLWGEFRKHVQQLYKGTPGYDTTYNAPLKFEPFVGAGILKKMADTTQRLTIKLNTPYTAIEKDGTGWKISITQNGRTDYIKAKALVDATEIGEIVTMAGATFPPSITYGDNLYRTSIVSGDDLSEQAISKASYYIPMSAFVVKDADNLFITDKALLIKPSMPIQMATGQGVGTMAAYCAFFKTTTKNLKVRPVQSELLDFKGYLLSFDDVDSADRYFRAIQQVAVTGLLKGTQKIQANQTRFLFMPDSTVNSVEIKPVLNEIYSRAFIWFNNIKPADKLTIGNTLSFISEITLADPESFRIKMQKEWKTKYKFNSEFDLNQPITRREFAILANQYINPFARTVDMSGRMVN
ncbi:FAD-dependent oxidoreductase [Mucilaginibacter sp. UYCu711]|uniref:FAD-dependent oxidoreductase n=1 Tax=Mucilaginibacter sp. UYCu711 TaxID=3156339 RepID=UPI003D208968